MIPRTATRFPHLLETDHIMTETVQSAAPLEVCRFVTRNGSYPTTGGYAPGATIQTASAAGQNVGIFTLGNGVVEVGAAIAAADLPLYSDAAGKARPVTDAATQITLGYSIDTATGTGLEYVRFRRA